MKAWLFFPGPYVSQIVVYHLLDSPVRLNLSNTLFQIFDLVLVARSRESRAYLRLLSSCYLLTEKTSDAKINPFVNVQALPDSGKNLPMCQEESGQSTVLFEVYSYYCYGTK